LGKVLVIFLLRRGEDLSLTIEQDGARTGRALVECKDELHRRLAEFSVKQADRPDSV
jgi:hypothetical protein